MEEKTVNLTAENQLLLDRIAALEKLNVELVEQNKALIEENKEKDDILAFLPSQAAKEMKIGGKKSLRYKMVTVLFADVKGFTKLTEQTDADTLIDELDTFFIRFDEIVKKYNIQKIKSIGDSYMCAGGIPKKNRTNAIEVIMAALEVREYMKDLQRKYEDENKKIWDLTFGVHTGAVVASTSGKKKISYDIKGDTVNIASRIESASESGIINISEMTYEFVKDYFVCEYRGKMPIKYKGDIPMYQVKGLRTELATDAKAIIPNHQFNIKFQLIKYDDLEEFILNKLEQELPKHLYYHNLKHTIDVTIGVEIIGSGEGISDEELLLLKTAALFHDSGQIKGSVGHEARGCVMMREILPKWGYSEEQLVVMEGIIMATMLPPTPKTKLEEIICDADLDYLGRPDFVPVSDTLFDELKVQNLVVDLNLWNKLQVKFLSAHQFFTKTAQQMRSVNKEAQIERIKQLIK